MREVRRPCAPVSLPPSFACSPLPPPTPNPRIRFRIRARLTPAPVPAAPPSRQGGAHTVSARLLTISPEAWNHYRRASAAFAANRAELAEAEAAKALALAPRFAEVDFLRALAALAAGRSADTLTLLTAARTLAPDLPWLGIGAAGALNNLHRYEAALTELATIPGPEATGWEAAYERARAEVSLADIPAALFWSERAVTLAPPGCTDARLVHANALRLASRAPEAITELETFLAEDRRGIPRPNVLAALAKARASASATSSTAQAASVTEPTPAAPSTHGLLALR